MSDNEPIKVSVIQTLPDGSCDFTRGELSEQVIGVNPETHDNASMNRVSDISLFYCERKKTNMYMITWLKGPSFILGEHTWRTNAAVFYPHFMDMPEYVSQDGFEEIMGFYSYEDAARYERQCLTELRKKGHVIF
jgi:hypothetical protein